MLDLAAMHGRYLSLAGHITLAKSIINVIPTYSMQVEKIPMSRDQELDRITKKFIQDSSESQRKPSLVNWDIIYSPKTLEGLGLHQTVVFNRAFLMLLQNLTHSRFNSYEGNILQLLPFYPFPSWLTMARQSEKVQFRSGHTQGFLHLFFSPFIFFLSKQLKEKSTHILAFLSYFPLIQTAYKVIKAPMSISCRIYFPLSNFLPTMQGSIPS